MNFFGVKFFVTSFILKVRKSKKKSACLDAYLHVYTRKRDRGGTLCPPPALNRVKLIMPIGHSKARAFKVALVAFL